jgi:hypothetical protein
VPYSNVIELCSLAILMISSTTSLLLFLSNSLKYLRLNSSHFFSSCPNHFLNVLLGAISILLMQMNGYLIINTFYMLK